MKRRFICHYFESCELLLKGVTILLRPVGNFLSCRTMKNSKECHNPCVIKKNRNDFKEYKTITTCITQCLNLEYLQGFMCFFLTLKSLFYKTLVKKKK